MKTITLVTGNPDKLAEWQRMFPKDITLEAVDLDLDEIQSLDLEAIVIDKARRAYEKVKGPVIVEDISAGLVNLDGLPGPFIKYFELAMGRDALYKLADKAGDAATVTCLVAYCDGEKTTIARADIQGTVAPTRGNNGFGFDGNFMPAGSTRTYGEMKPEEKDAISHRSKAIKELVEQLSRS